MAAPKYRALDAAVTGLPWTTGTVHTAKCSKGFEVNKDMFRRCGICSYLLCSKCHDRDGFSHQCADGGPAESPFPTHVQESLVLSVFNAIIPPRDASRPNQKFHSTGWQWTPPPEILKSHPQIRLEGEKLHNGPAPVAEGSATSSLSTLKKVARTSTPRGRSTVKEASSSKATTSVTKTANTSQNETTPIRVKKSPPAQPQLQPPPAPSLPPPPVATAVTPSTSAPPASQDVSSMTPKTSAADSIDSDSSASDDASVSGGDNEAGEEELPRASVSPEVTLAGDGEPRELKRKAAEFEDDEDDIVDDADRDVDEPVIFHDPSGGGEKRGRGGRGRGRGSGRGGPARSSRAQAVAAQRIAKRKAKSMMKNNVAQGFESDETVEQAFENDIQQKRTIKIDVRGVDTLNLTLFPGFRLGGPMTNSAALDGVEQNSPIQLPAQLFYQWQNSTLNYQLERNVVATIDAPGHEIDAPASSTVGSNWRYEGTGKSMTRDLHNVFLCAITGDEIAGDVDAFNKPFENVQSEINALKEALMEAGISEEVMAEELGMEDDEMMGDEEMLDEDEYEIEQEDEDNLPKEDEDSYEETEDDDLYTDD